MPSVTAKDPGLNLEPDRFPRVQGRGDSEGIVQARAGLITEVPPAPDYTEIRPEEKQDHCPLAGLSQVSGAAQRKDRQAKTWPLEDKCGLPSPPQ